MPSDFESDESFFEPSPLERETIDAIQMGKTQAVASCLARGATPHFVAGGFGARPLHLAAQSDKADVILLLAEKGADINRPDTQGQSPLFHAAEKGGLGGLRQLLELRADPNHLAYSGRTALFAAALRGRADIVTELLLHGADPNIIANGSSALLYATSAGHFDAVRALVQGGARLDFVSAQGETAAKLARRLPADPRRKELLAAFLEAAVIQDEAVNGVGRPVETLKVLRFRKDS